MSGTPRASRAFAMALAVVMMLVGCSDADTEQPEPSEHTEASLRTEVQTSDPDAALTVIASTKDVEASLATSRALFDTSPLVVIAPSGDATAQELSARAAVDMGVPLLIAPAADAADAGPTPTSAPLAPAASASTNDDGEAMQALATELQRLESTTALVVGDVAPVIEDGGSLAVERVLATADALHDSIGLTIDEPTASEAAGYATGIAGLDAPAPGGTAAMPGESTPAGAVPRPSTAEPLTDTFALAVDAVDQLASIATARATGVPVVLVPEASTNPQTTPSIIDALHASTTTRTIAIGAAFGSEPALEWQVRSARGGYQLPAGGQLLFDQHLFVALYGTPGTRALGVLGEQDAAGSVERARDLAASYSPLTDRTVVPMFEIIATVAGGQAGPDGNYSNELPIDRLRPFVDAAADAGIYVVIDLQPGRTDFLSQAQQYESLLEMPNVGLALDPEWRLEPDEVHLQQIGSVSAAEVNSVVTWLADLTNERGLPQKMLVLHQFRRDMIIDRAALDLSRPELAVLIHADGQGTQPAKQTTWAALLRDAPDGLHWGWKNFYDEDVPMLTPEQTMSEISPVPDLVTYQ